MDNKKYLNELGIEGVFLARVEAIIERYNMILNKTKPDILFICDQINLEGDREYSSLNLIYNDKFCEAKNFLISKPDVFDAADFNIEKIDYWEISCENYDYVKAVNSSRLNFEFRGFGTSTIVGVFKATGNNCDYLLEIIKGISIKNIDSLKSE